MAENQYVIVGTAGHIDHGKTELVRALTGVDTDRLKAEKERGISIELGFAPLLLPSGRKIGLVDVPGHERFIRQMLAGAAGMDIVLLIVAADEGVMPQTTEHLQIINLLNVKSGITIITKIDLVEDDWIDLVEQELIQTVKGTVLAGGPIIKVSALTGEGIDHLIHELDKMVSLTPPKTTRGIVRLPIDRVFSVTGFGKVVTGTLWSGEIATGQILEVAPLKIPVRVRNLEVHGETESKAVAGQRVAVNLAGPDVDLVERGHTVSSPNDFNPTLRVDAQINLIKDTKALKNRTRIHFYLGTQEVLARVIWLDRDEVLPGGNAFAQLVFEDAVVCARGDRFVIRSYSPMLTIGGGEIINPNVRKHKRNDLDIINALQVKLTGDPKDLILQEIANQNASPITCSDLAHKLDLIPEVVQRELERLLTKGELVEVIFEGNRNYFAEDQLQQKLNSVLEVVKDYHQRYPLRRGIPKEELRSRLFKEFNPKVVNVLLDHWRQQQKINLQGQLISDLGFDPKPEPMQQLLLDKIRAAYGEGWFQPPDKEQLKALHPAPDLEELLHYLVNQGAIVKINEDLYYDAQAYLEAKAIIAELGHGGKTFNLGEVRDRMHSSRKYVLPLLEFFDQIKATRRVGDLRILGSLQQEKPDNG